MSKVCILLTFSIKNDIKNAIFVVKKLYIFKKNNIFLIFVIYTFWRGKHIINE